MTRSGSPRPVPGVRLLHTGAALALSAALAACGGARTSPATQPTPAAFDPAASDPKAIAVVDQMQTALGGAAAWDQAKQVRWSQKYYRDGKLLGWFEHSWDRWNGRHRFEDRNMPSVEKAQAEGRPDDIQSTVAMYDLFDHDGKGFATFDGQQVDRATRDKIVASAHKAWQADAYRLFIFHKLKDPGVRLQLEAPRAPIEKLPGLCDPGCDVVKVTFAPEVGTDTWYVSINTSTRMPDILERDVPASGGAAGGRLGFGLSGWIEAGGIKVPGKLDNIGMSETFEISDLRVGEPDDSLYIPAVQ